MLLLIPCLYESWRVSYPRKKRNHHFFHHSHSTRSYPPTLHCHPFLILTYLISRNRLSRTDGGVRRFSSKFVFDFYKAWVYAATVKWLTEGGSLQEGDASFPILSRFFYCCHICHLLILSLKTSLGASFYFLYCI